MIEFSGILRSLNLEEIYVADLISSRMLLIQMLINTSSVFSQIFKLLADIMLVKRLLLEELSITPILEGLLLIKRNTMSLPFCQLLLLFLQILVILVVKIFQFLVLASVVSPRTILFLSMAMTAR